MNFKVKGLRIEHILTYNDRENVHEENEKHILLLEKKIPWNNAQKYELALWTVNGDCYSGWCCASYGNSNLYKVKEFNGMSHTPKKDMEFSLDIEEMDLPDEISDVDNEVLSCSYNDGDVYYANGHAFVNLELFEPTPRVKEARPVWIFTGDSNVGKSYLSHLISNTTDKEVYETDTEEKLPEHITADIVVIGNKFSFTEDQVKQRLVGSNNEVIHVRFGGATGGVV